MEKALELDSAIKGNKGQQKITKRGKIKEKGEAKKAWWGQTKTNGMASCDCDYDSKVLTADC